MPAVAAAAHHVDSQRCHCCWQGLVVGGQGDGLALWLAAGARRRGRGEGCGDSMAGSGGLIFRRIFIGIFQYEY